MMLLSNVIVDIIISHRSFVFSLHCLEVPASLSDAGGLAVRAFDLVNHSLPCLLLGSSSSLILFSKCRSVVIGLWAMQML